MTWWLHQRRRRVTEAATSEVTPDLEEDFSTYTDTADFLSDPRGIWKGAEALNSTNIVLDTTVGYDDSTQSMRYDWPNNGVNCSDYQIRPGFLEIASSQTHVWVEYVVAFSTTFDVDAGSTACAAEYKLAVAGDYGQTGRWDISEMQDSKFVVGYPPAQTSDATTDVVPNTIWDGADHVCRAEMQTGSTSGVIKYWVDDTLVFDSVTSTGTGAHVEIDYFSPGLNMNQGPATTDMQMWWKRIAVWYGSNDPGWS